MRHRNGVAQNADPSEARVRTETEGARHYTWRRVRSA